MTNNGHTEGSAPVAGMPSNGQRSASGTGLDDPRVHEAMEEYLRLLQAGQRPDRQAFLARFPEVAHALELCLQGLDFVHAAGGELSQPDNSPADLDTGLGGAATLGDFRIGREVGRGGMGVVYEAEQVSLGRRVALKVLPFAGALDPKQLRRFQNEARAAAQLHHTNIVPVHFVGSERGVHFYAMQFIDGQSLADVIRGLRQKDRSQGSGVGSQGSGVGSQKEDTGPGSPATGPYQPPAGAAPARDTAVVAGLSTERSIRGREYIRSVARLGIQAAEALEHAHDMGVVHRDVKPANLLLDVDGRLWVTDFGLALLHADAGLTVTGDLVGTLRYMSPEQALAKRVVVDHRTDIYSLGVTLYELLTLRPAYEGTDRQELLRRIAFDEPRPPCRLNKAIPRELETIILKAMAKNPAERYATAQELADDLERLLRDEPIKARRPNLVQRARKWSRRHPAVMASTLVGLVLAVVALSVSNLLIARANQQKQLALQDRETALRAAEEAKAAAEQSAAETKAVLEFVEDRILAAARPSGQEGGLGRDVALRRALEAAMPSVSQRFANQPLIEARLRRTLGLTFRYLGEEIVAAQQFQAARTLYAKHRGPDHAETLASMNNLANSYAALGRHADALNLREETLALRRASLGPDHPDTFASMNNLANSYADLGRHAESLKVREETLALRLAKLGPDHPETLASMNNLAISYSDLGRHAEAVKLREETLALTKTKFSPDHPRTLACMHNLAESYHALGRHADALALYEETLALAEAKLSPTHPHTLLVMNNLAWLLTTAQDERFRDPARAVALAAKAAQLSPKKADFASTLGIARYRAGDWKQAEQDLERAIRLRRPDDARNANESFFLAMTRWRLGDKSGARTWFDKGAAWMEKGKLRDDELRRFRAEAAVVLGIRDRP